MDGKMNGWRDGWIERMDGWMDDAMNERGMKG